MEPEPVPPAPQPRSATQFVFFNERGLRAGWRLLIFISILAVFASLFLLVIRSLRAVAAAPSQPQLSSSFFLPISQGIGELIIFLVALLATFLMSRIERRKVGVYGLPLKKATVSQFAVGCFFWGFLPLTVVLAIMRGLGVFHFGTPVLDFSQALSWGAAWAFGFLTVGLQEEYVFRGYALQTLAEGIGFWPAAIIFALLFGRTHMGNGGESYIGIVGTIIYALFASATLRRTGNLWLAVGAHAGWDWGQTFFFGVNDSGFQAPGHLFNPPSPHGPIWLSGGTVGPEGSIVTLIVWGLMTVGFLMFYRSRSET